MMTERGWAYFDENVTANCAVLPVVCVEPRFGTSKTSHVVEWLSDNGSVYIAKDTFDTAMSLGLRLCSSPLRSPESNGIAEAFVKTFKRDYARLSICRMPRLSSTAASLV